MTLDQLIQFTNEYRLGILRMHHAFMHKRRYGVKESPINHRDLLNIRVLEALIAANENRNLGADLLMPVWLQPIEFDTLITQLQKRLIL